MICSPSRGANSKKRPVRRQAARSSLWSRSSRKGARSCMPGLTRAIAIRRKSRATRSRSNGRRNRAELRSSPRSTGRGSSGLSKRSGRSTLPRRRFWKNWLHRYGTNNDLGCSPLFRSQYLFDLGWRGQGRRPARLPHLVLAAGDLAIAADQKEGWRVPDEKTLGRGVAAIVDRKWKAQVSFLANGGVNLRVFSRDDADDVQSSAAVFVVEGLDRGKLIGDLLGIT